jgi:predicted O-methyltransferase YrrM
VSEPAARVAALLGAADLAKGFMPRSEGLALFSAARRAAASGLGPLVEIGSYCGKSALYLAAGIAAATAGPAPGRASTPCSVLFSIDHHRGSTEQQAGWPDHDPSLVDPESAKMDSLPSFRATIAGAAAEDLVIGVLGDASVVARSWPGPVGLVFIDGAHGEAEAARDFEAWTPLVAPGGWLAIHDVFPDRAAGGRPPYDGYARVMSSGAFVESSIGCGSLRLLCRLPA